MNKYFAIGLSIAITAFLAANAILLFSERSQVPKKLYISEYERTYTSSYSEKLPKEAITARWEPRKSLYRIPLQSNNGSSMKEIMSKPAQNWPC
nr:hypothetical protein [Planococcus salinarum]